VRATELIASLIGQREPIENAGDCKSSYCSIIVTAPDQPQIRWLRVFNGKFCGEPWHKFAGDCS
jgi:hypothetical protein